MSQARSAGPEAGKGPRRSTYDPGVEEIGRLRNLGIVAHIDAGKTTLSERILLETGVIRHAGEVHEGSTVLDWMPEERRRGISITAAVTTVKWRGARIHLIDTPGHVDFTVEVERSLRVLDGAVLVISALAGVQAQSETVWRQARRHRIPGLVFVNQCDRQGADFLRAVADLRERLGMEALPIALPVGEGPGLRGVVDLLTRRAFLREDGGRDLVECPVPEEVALEVELLRGELIEALAERDDGILGALVEERDPSSEDLRRALRKRTLEGSLTPVLCGSALLDLGVQALLDGVVDFLPSPLERGPVEGQLPGGGAEQRAPDPDAPTCALAFKLLRTRREELTLVRLYAGGLRAGDELINPRNGAREQVRAIYAVHADSLEPLAAARCGEIVALAGCRATGTGDTLCAPGSEIALEGLALPRPVVSQVIEPQRDEDRGALGEALAAFEREDPTLELSEDPDTGQWVVSGMGELHLDVLARRLEEEFGLSARWGRPKVTYREAPLAAARGESRIERQLGAEAGWAEARVRLEPDESVEGLALERAVAASGQERLWAAALEALEREGRAGPRTGNPLGRARVVLEYLAVGRGAGEEAGEPSGAHGQETSDEGEFLAGEAARVALRDALRRSRLELREPLMALEIDLPAEASPQVLASLGSLRADVREVRSEGSRCTVRAAAPLAALFGYATRLRSITQGRAVLDLMPSGSRPVADRELAELGLE